MHLNHAPAAVNGVLFDAANAVRAGSQVRFESYRIVRFKLTAWSQRKRGLSVCDGQVVPAQIEAALESANIGDSVEQRGHQEVELWARLESESASLRGGVKTRKEATLSRT